MKKSDKYYGNPKQSQFHFPASFWLNLEPIEETQVILEGYDRYHAESWISISYTTRQVGHFEMLLWNKCNLKWSCLLEEKHPVYLLLNITLDIQHILQKVLWIVILWQCSTKPWANQAMWGPWMISSDATSSVIQLGSQLQNTYPEYSSEIIETHNTTNTPYLIK